MQFKFTIPIKEILTATRSASTCSSLAPTSSTCTTSFSTYFSTCLIANEAYICERNLHLKFISPLGTGYICFIFPPPDIFINRFISEPPDIFVNISGLPDIFVPPTFLSESLPPPVTLLPPDQSVSNTAKMKTKNNYT